MLRLELFSTLQYICIVWSAFDSYKQFSIQFLHQNQVNSPIFENPSIRRVIFLERSIKNEKLHQILALVTTWWWHASSCLPLLHVNSIITQWPEIIINYWLESSYQFYIDCINTIDSRYIAVIRHCRQHNNYNDNTWVRFALTNNTPYLCLTGEIWGVFHELYKAKWLCYTLYRECTVIDIRTTYRACASQWEA